MKTWMDRQDTSFSKGWWLKPIAALERKETSGGAGQGVVGIFIAQELLGPGTGENWRTS